jgi:hypothetical protein
MDEIRPDRTRFERSRRARSIWIVSLLILSTTLSLVLAWAKPQATLWQYWAVTQCLPVFYLVLTVWAAWPLPAEAEP